MVGPRTWIGGIFNRFGNKRDKDLPLSPLEEERLQRLQERIKVPFDETSRYHKQSLVTLWNISFPDVVLTGLISNQWKDMGWQGANPSTDFRGCGFVSLENMLFFAKTYPKSFHRLLLKERGVRATWEYPFAVAGINITFMMIQMLDLFAGYPNIWGVTTKNASFSIVVRGKPRCAAGVNFVRLLGEDEEAFEVLFCMAFELMDAQWLAMGASYMEFNEVLQETRAQLERELCLEDVHRIRDLPAYNLILQ